MKLTGEQVALRDTLVQRLRAAWDDVEARVDDYNGAASEAWKRVQAALEEYEIVRADAEELRDEVAGDGESAISDKSEKWQESAKGQAASAWVDEWSGLDLDGIEQDEPEQLEIGEPSHWDDLESLPEESGP